MSLKHNLLVVVWEWQNKQGRWRPYSPDVTQLLERAYTKNLKSVMLGDADSSLHNLQVNLSKMIQISKEFDSDIQVQRSTYPQNSPPGQGVVWQWAGDNEGDWHTYDMCVQCVLENSWMTGADSIDMANTFPLCPYVINFCNMNQINKRTGYVRSIRRITQAPYPIGKAAQPSQIAQGTLSNDINQKRESQATSSTTEQKKNEAKTNKDDTKIKNESEKRSIFKKVLNMAVNSGSENNSNKNISAKTPSPKVNADNDSNKSGLKSQAPCNCVKSLCSNTQPSQSTQSQMPKKPPVPLPRTRFSNSKTCDQSADERHNFQSKFLSNINQFNYQYMGSHSKADSDLHGSTFTLNSENSSLSVRRPSIETISTYLSQDAEESMDCDSSSFQNSSCETESLISFDNNNGQVFYSDDDEICNINSTTSNGSSKTMQNQYVLNPSNHFMPISTPLFDSGTLKCKRTRDNDLSSGNNNYNHNVQNSSSVQFSQNHNQGAAPKPKTRSCKECASQQDPMQYSGKKVSAFNLDKIKGCSKNKFLSISRNKSEIKRRSPADDKEKLIIEHAQPISDDSGDCPICMDDFNPDSEKTAKYFLVSYGVKLKSCDHSFHEDCLLRLLSFNQNTFFQCPSCKKLYGEKWGTQPIGGKMTVNIYPSSLPGHPGVGTVEIIYNMKPGIQGSEHPNPGRRYHCIGFPRVAYLPDSAKGQRVLKLLQEAFRRRLIFTVGTSVTMGIEDAVTWNEIHHKTSTYNNTGHGYPDPAYLDNVIEELRSHGVVD